MSAPFGMSRVPRPDLVQYATSIRSVSPIFPLGLGGAKLQKSESVLDHDMAKSLQAEILSRTNEMYVSAS